MNLNKKIVFVNNPAAINGGALTILKQFIENVAIKCDDNYIFYIFCTVNIKQYECNNIKIINNINAKSWKDRLYWDTIGLKKWSIAQKIKPNLIISLQNTGIGSFRDVKQFVYLHQSLPYYENVKWNPFNSYERIYWFYKSVYKRIIHYTTKNKYIVVQNNWMKRKIIKHHKIDERNIFVIRPNIIEIDNSIKFSRNINEKFIFYPASAEIYKNHIVLIKALHEMKNEKNLNNIKLYLTLDKCDNENLYELVKEYDLESNIKFLGKLSYDEVIENYKQCSVVVFPSYIETVGLPLLEAAQCGKPIVVSDLEYSREILNGYNGVEFVKFDDEKQWLIAIVKQLNNKGYYEYSLNSKNDSWEKFIEIITECEKF